MASTKKLLGGLSFVSRTYEGSFKENPYVLDMDANLFIGPADHISRDEHSAVEVVFHFLAQTDRLRAGVRSLLRNRVELLRAFGAFDQARSAGDAEEFRIHLFGTYDGDMLESVTDDELPAGPCGKSVNEIKRQLYRLCERVDRRFDERTLTNDLQEVESRFVLPD